jgi:hypothetical protein
LHHTQRGKAFFESINFLARISHEGDEKWKMTRVIYRSDFSAVDFTDHVAAHHFASFVSALVQKKCSRAADSHPTLDGNLFFEREAIRRPAVSAESCSMTETAAKSSFII